MPLAVATSILGQFREQARRNPKHIVLPEGEDPRILRAAITLQEEKIARITVLGNKKAVLAKAKEERIPSEKVMVIDPTDQPDFEDYVDQFYDLRKARGISRHEARETVSDPLYYANLMVRNGRAEGSVAGATNTTANTVRAAIQAIGLARGIRLVSSFFLMELPDKSMGENGVLLFADCGVVVEPSATELADIAVSSARNFKTLVGSEPRIALLSFSTKGSARHAHQSKVAEAAKIIRATAPELDCDGELQADAALIASVGKSKAPDSVVAGKANVLIFPNLDAGNIGYKLVERLAGATAIGPILQGLEKPANDLSRGCKVSDIVDMAAITAVMAQAGPR